MDDSHGSSQVVRFGVFEADLQTGELHKNLDGLPQVNNWNAWTTVHGGIYFVPVDLPDSLRYYDFASGQMRDVLKLQKDFSDGLSISPDGRYLLYSQVDDLNADIMLVENYR